jgi:hypothetical protein
MSSGDVIHSSLNIHSMKSKKIILFVFMLSAFKFTCSQTKVANELLVGEWQIKYTLDSNETKSPLLNSINLLFVQFGDSLLWGIEKNDTILFNSFVNLLSTDNQKFDISQSGRTYYSDVSDSLIDVLSHAKKLIIVSDTVICIKAENDMNFYCFFDSLSGQDTIAVFSTNPRDEYEWMKAHITRETIIQSFFYKMNQYFTICKNLGIPDAGSCIIFDYQGNYTCESNAWGVISGNEEVCNVHKIVFGLKNEWVGLNASNSIGLEPTKDPVNYPEMIKDTTTSNIKTQGFNKYGVKIYPNPPENNMYFRIPLKNKHLELKIYDICGTCCKSIQLGDSYIQHVNIENLKSGIYFCRIFSGDKIYYQDKLLINK